MKNAVNGIWLLIILVGAIWFLQGINILARQLHDRGHSLGFLWRGRDGVGAVALLLNTNRRREKAEVVGAQGFEPRTPSV